MLTFLNNVGIVYCSIILIFQISTIRSAILNKDKLVAIAGNFYIPILIYALLSLTGVL